VTSVIICESCSVAMKKTSDFHSCCSSSFLVCAFIYLRSDPFSSILSFGHHRPSGAQDSSPACLVLDLACSDFSGSEIFRSDRLDLSSGLICFCHCFFRARIGLWVQSSLGSPFVWFPRLAQAMIPHFSFFCCSFLFPLRSPSF
jgi:hypothetical protein